MDSTPTLDPPTNELTAPLAAPSTDRCANCGARMAPDQRYCLECGERRTGGGLRDALPRTQTVAPVAAASRRSRMSPNSSLIAGVATLLIALGVGVLIGRTGDGNGGKAAAPQIVTVSAGAAGAAGTTGDTAAAGSSSASKAAKAKKKAAAAKAKSSAGESSIDETAKKNGVKLPPKVVKIGQKCEKGAKGCQGGKFTGNFFGGG